MVSVGIGLIYVCALRLADVFVWLDNVENQFYLSVIASFIFAGLGTYWAYKRLKSLL